MKTLTVKGWAVALCCALLTGCATGSTRGMSASSAPIPAATRRSGAVPVASPADPTSTPRRSGSPGTLTLAFAGDANSFGHAANALTTGLGDAGRLLADADLAVVNVETALADSPTGLRPEPKTYHFLAGADLPLMLRREGVDVMSMANNHAMDYGSAGLERTLAIIREHQLPVIGVGTASAAYGPRAVTAADRRVLLFAGNDVQEADLRWQAGPTTAGVAMTDTPEGLDALVSSVRRARRGDPGAVIVVDMHWGLDYQVCMTTRQEGIAHDLADAGADVVVGSHVHRVQRMEVIGHTLVMYGLGNFLFDSDRPATRETGVLTVTVPARAATGRATPTARWAPGRIVDGRPVLLAGTDRDAATSRWRTLPGGC